MANAVSTNGHDDGGGGGGGIRPPRLPRWTRQEILVLIQGKKMAESRGRGRSRVQQIGSSTTAAAPLVGVGTPVEPKWATVSSYCRQHGVNRGPVQCRKRWSNLAGDFKKIKEWEIRREEGGGGPAAESFWSMRNDLRRERRLPGFFDREVYDILDGAVEVGGDADEVGRKTEEVAPPSPAAVGGDEEEDDEPVFDSGRAAAEDVMFSDLEGDDDGDDDEKPPAAPTSSPSSAAPVMAATPISERKADSHGPSSSGQATVTEKPQPAEDLEERQIAPREANKRKRLEQEELPEPTLVDRLVDILEQNSRVLNAHLEAQNLNSQLDRDLRRDQTNSVVQVLSKLTDVLSRLADKLQRNTSA